MLLAVPLLLLSLLVGANAAPPPAVEGGTKRGPLRMPVRRQIAPSNRLAKRGRPMSNTSVSSSPPADGSINNLDASGMSFVIDVDIGTPPQPIAMGLTFFGDQPMELARNCTQYTESCHLFMANQSSTFNATDGTEIAHDNVKIGDVEFPNQEIVWKTKTDNPDYPETYEEWYSAYSYYSGLAGSIPLNMGSKSVLPALLDAAGSSREMGLFVAQTLPQSLTDDPPDMVDYNVGELSIGALNTELYTGDINYVPMLNGSQFTIRLDELRIGNQSINLAQSNTSTPRRDATLQIVTGGVSGFMLSPSIYLDISNKLISMMGLNATAMNATEAEEGGLIVPCKPALNLTLVIGGRDYVIPFSGWTQLFDLGDEVMIEPICIPNISPNRFNKSSSDNVPEATIIVGSVFLSTVYTAIKLDNDSPQIGFAQLSDAAKRFMPLRKLNASDTLSSVPIPRPTGWASNSHAGSDSQSTSAATGTLALGPVVVAALAALLGVVI